jgi:starch phosphorylase
MPILTCWERQNNVQKTKKNQKLLIDIGGTNLRYLIKDDKEIITSNSLSSEGLSLYDFLVTTLSKNKKITFVGISFAGQVNENVIISAPNIEIQNGDIKKQIESEFDVRVEIDNDLKTALLAEMDVVGDDKSLTLLYMGTGLGSASSQNGTLIRGGSNFAGEIGHIPFQNAPFKCGCGKYDCVELFASGSALIKWIEHYQIPVDEPTIEALDALDTAESKEVVANFHKALSHAASTLVTLLNPEFLVLGGGVFEKNPSLVAFLQEELSKHCFKPSFKNLQIKLSDFHNANLIGAELLEQYRRNNMIDVSNEELYSTKAAYFSMEFGLDQALKIYSGGLGFLAGSHMRSVYDLKQNVIGVGMLWSYGYYDQVREADGSMRAEHSRKKYQFLDDPNVTVTVIINHRPVHVKAYLLKPETFQTAPMVLLSTDIPENDHLSQTITSKLYDGNNETRIAQEIVLGVGGLKALEALGEKIDIYHMNEGHAVPLTFNLYEKYQNVDEVKKRVVFTTHTPEAAGNEEHDIGLLHRMGFFSSLDIDTVREITGIQGNLFSLTVGALKLSKISNAVSKIHADVANDMWKDILGKDEKIIPITNAQNRRYWQDKGLFRAFDENVDYEIVSRKKHLKRMLFNIVANQTGKIFDPDTLTIVWARRFAEYKRPGLLKYDYERFLKIVESSDKPVQIIWAGKPYPTDGTAVGIFNDLVYMSKDIKNIAVLTGYELELSAAMKKGADVWINTPRVNREASGTSGMTAAMNGAVHFSIPDGWHPEFARHGENAYTIPGCDDRLSTEEQDKIDNKNMMNVLENEIIPTYYNDQKKWVSIIKNAMRDVLPYFNSERMAHEYYVKMYDARYKGVQSETSQKETVLV